MATEHRENKQEVRAENETEGCLPALVRLIWMVAGNVVLLFIAALIAKGSSPVVMDVLFFATAAGLIIIRYIDIASFKGETSEGKPATFAHWRRYAVLMVLVATGMWALAWLTASRGWM